MLPGPQMKERMRDMIDKMDCLEYIVEAIKEEQAKNAELLRQKDLLLQALYEIAQITDDEDIAADAKRAIAEYEEKK